MLEYFLLSRLSTNNLIFDIGILLFVIPMITFITKFFQEDFWNYFKSWKNSTWSIITLEGWENNNNGHFFFDYPKPMISICYYIISRNLAPNIRFFNQIRNNMHYFEAIEKIGNKEGAFNYIMDDKDNFKINDNIYVDFSKRRLPNKDKDGNTLLYWMVSLKIKSKNLSCLELKKFIDTCVEEYTEYEKNRNKNKIFHFIYQGFINDRLQFSQNLFRDTKKESEINYETFDSLFGQHKENIINSVKRLKDYSYFKRTGSKRKLGYLFHGPPGCGKTAHVAAIANFDNRHILEVPMSRIKTNKELEEIINLTSINDVIFKKEELIIFFDEMDQAGNALQKRKEEVKNNEQKNKVDDELNLENILSRLDGIGNYNGLIIIATTNCIDKLSPALYRNGRLSALEFSYCRKEDIISMIEFYYKIKLTKEEIINLPDIKSEISPATLKKYLEENDKNYKDLLVILKSKII